MRCRVMYFGKVRKRRCELKYLVISEENEAFETVICDDAYGIAVTADSSMWIKSLQLRDFE